MKSEKGITLISVTIYVIVMAIVIGIIAVISGFFYKSIDGVDETVPAQEFTEFNRYFTDEINRDGAEIISCESNYVVFNNNVEYTFVAGNKGIYRNGVKICRDIDSCTFTKGSENGKKTITVEMIVSGRVMTTTYALKS